MHISGYVNVKKCPAGTKNEEKLLKIWGKKALSDSNYDLNIFIFRTIAFKRKVFDSLIFK